MDVAYLTHFPGVVKCGIFDTFIGLKCGFPTYFSTSFTHTFPQVALDKQKTEIPPQYLRFILL